MDIRVLQYFLSVAREESIIKAELTSTNENINGDIHIGCGKTEAISFLAKAAWDLQQKHPLIHYHIYSGDAEHVMERLDKGLIDFGLLVGPVDVTKYDYIRLPLKDTWGILMRKDSSPADKDSIIAEDLWDKPLIISHQTSINGEIFHG